MIFTIALSFVVQALVFNDDLSIKRLNLILKRSNLLLKRLALILIKIDRAFTLLLDLLIYSSFNFFKSIERLLLSFLTL